MSRVTRREWYRRVNAAWPQPLPALTAGEAVRALRRLYRFAFKRTLQAQVKVTSGRRETQRRHLVWYVNPAQGWSDLVHVLSHYAERSGHNGRHARMELRMIREVVRRGWLDGRLRDPVTVTPPRDRVAERAVRAQAGLERWERKQRFAARKVSAYRRRVRYYERKAS